MTTPAKRARKAGPGRPAFPPQTRTTIYLPDELRERIDTARRGIPLAVWMREAVEQRLEREARPS